MQEQLARASDISRGKNQNFAGFSGAKSRKNRPISRDFCGKKVKIRGKISRFHRILAEKNSNFEGFLEKSADFAGNFRGKLHQETISKKQPILLDFFLANFAKIDSIFASIWPALLNVFLTGITICFFKQQFAEKRANVKAIAIMVSAQFFATFI